MTHEVAATPLAARQIGALTGQIAKAFEMWTREVAARGCAAFGYRLTGTGVDRFCVRHLDRRWRVVAAFEPDDVVRVLMVGQHLDRQPDFDVYRALYEMAGLAGVPTEARTKPSCCDPDGGSPVTEESEVDLLVERSASLARSRRRRR